MADAGIGTLACPLAVPPVENPMPREAEVPQFQVILIEVDDVRATTLGSHLICGAVGCGGGSLLHAPAWQPLAQIWTGVSTHCELREYSIA